MNKIHFIKENSHLLQNSRLLTDVILKFAYIAKRTGYLISHRYDLCVDDDYIDTSKSYLKDNRTYPMGFFTKHYKTLIIGSIKILSDPTLLRVIGFETDPDGLLQAEKFSHYLKRIENEQSNLTEGDSI